MRGRGRGGEGGGRGGGRGGGEGGGRGGKRDYDRSVAFLLSGNFTCFLIHRCGFLTVLMHRKSGDNRTGIKAEDKRGGGGKVIFLFPSSKTSVGNGLGHLTVHSGHSII